VASQSTTACSCDVYNNQTDAHSERTNQPSTPRYPTLAVDMAFGDVKLDLAWVYSFNTKLECLWRNEEFNEEPNRFNGQKLGILIDASGSMNDHQPEVKLILSALKCMTNTIGQFNAPKPNNQTALVDAVNLLIADRHMEGIEKLIILTDGLDNASKTKRLIVSVNEEGEHVYGDMPNTHNMETRTRAVATHLDAQNIEVHLVGLGSQVKDFFSVAIAPGRGLHTAHIEKGATAETVGAIVSTVVRRTRRDRNTSAPDQTIVAESAVAIGAAEAAAIATEAVRTTTAAERRSNPNLLIDGPPFDEDLQKKYVAHIINSETHKSYTPAATESEDTPSLADYVGDLLDVFRNIVHVGGKSSPVASAILGGQTWPSGKKLPSGEPDGTRKGALFEIPDGFPELKPSQWTRMLGRLIELLSRNPDAIVERVEVPFTDELKDAIRDNKVGPIFRPAGRPASHMAINHDLVGHPDLESRTMYFKFKADTYETYLLHHRDTSAWRPMTELLRTKCHIMRSGNSSAKSYGGPIPMEITTTTTTTANATEPVDPAPTEVASDSDNEATSSDAEEETAETTETKLVAAEREVQSLKRKLEERDKTIEELRTNVEELNDAKRRYTQAALTHLEAFTQA